MVDGARGIWKSVRALLWKGRTERELSEELAFHVEMETEKNVREGMSPEEARRAALISFRGVERYKEEVRSARRARWIEVLGQDAGMAVRTFRRSPGLAALVVLTLGLGIGASTGIFSVVDGAVLRPLPWNDPDRLVLVEEVTPRGSDFSFSEPNYLDFREATESLTALAAYRDVRPALTTDGRPERLEGLAVTHTFFPLLGARAAHGRTFRAEEDRAGGDTRVVVLSHGLWQRRFGGDPGIVDETVILDGESYRVTGVMPEDFEYFGTELWLPLAPSPLSDRMDHWLEVIGRLAPDATAAEAQAELAGISARLAEIHTSMAGWGARVTPLKEALVGPEFRQASVVLAAAVALLLLMACANVANLLLAHATARRGDLGVRLALGAGRGRVVRQLLTESLLLAVGGAVLGLIGAIWLVDIIRAAAPAAIPRVEQLAVDFRVLGFAAATALATSVLAGFLPALHAARTDAAAQLRDGVRSGTSRGQRKVRDGLVVAQVAVAVVLLLGAGLLVRSFLHLQAVDPGFRTENVWSVPLQLPESRYSDPSDQFFAYRDILDEVRAIPGVVNASAAFVDPFGTVNATNNVTPVERAAEVTDAGFMQARWRAVSPSYFETMGVPLLQGRLFTSEDRYGNPPTVLITRTLAERLWPGEDAVGKQLYWGGTDGEPRTVVGVVGDIRDISLEADPDPVMFLSYRQLALPSMSVLVRTRGRIESLADALREAVWTVDPTLPVPVVRSMSDSRATSISGPRFNALVLAAFALVSMILAAVGLYGLLGFIVARQTREIGVRRALGARPGTVSSMIVRRGLVLAGMGIGIGIVVTLGFNRFIESLLFETTRTDPVTFVAVPLLFALIAAAAAWIPARRAARVSPMIALRGD